MLPQSHLRRARRGRHLLPALAALAILLPSAAAVADPTPPTYAPPASDPVMQAGQVSPVTTDGVMAGTGQSSTPAGGWRSSARART